MLTGSSPAQAQMGVMAGARTICIPSFRLELEQTPCAKKRVVSVRFIAFVVRVAHVSFCSFDFRIGA